MFIFKIIEIGTFIIQKSVAIHKAGADADVLEAIHKAISAVHKTVDVLHKTHVGEEEESDESIKEND